MNTISMITPNEFIRKMDQFNREQEYIGDGDMSGLGKAYALIEGMSIWNRAFLKVYVWMFNRKWYTVFRLWAGIRKVLKD